MDTLIKEKIVTALTKLKKASQVYQKATEEQRGRLINACEPLFVELVNCGYDRVFVESLLVSGKEFLDSFHKETEGTEKDLGIDSAKIIFS